MKSNSRYLGALMIAPFIIFVFLGGVWLEAFTIVLSILGLYEFYHALKQKDRTDYLGLLIVTLFMLDD